MKKSRTILSLLLILISAAYSNSFERQEEKVQLALDEMYNMNLDESNILFTEVLHNEPFHPLAPVGALATRWLINQEIQGFRKGNEQLLKEIDTTLIIYRDEIDKYPDNTDILFYYGTAMGLKARIQLAEKDWLGVLLSGYKSMQYIKHSFRENPEMWDIYLPIGVFNYYVGVSSSYMKIASWIMSESGSKDEGLQQMQIAEKHGNYSRYEARNLLAFILLYMEEDYYGSLKYSSMMAEKFPDNPYHFFLAAEALIILHKYDRAKIYMEKHQTLIPELRGNTKNENILKTHLLKGTLALHSGDLITAEEELRYTVDTYDLELDWHIAYANMRLGNVYDLQGKRETAIECYKKAISSDNRTSAYKWAKKYVNTPYTGEGFHP